MKTRINHLLILFAFLGACSSFDDADLTERSTFMRFYSSPVGYVATAAEFDKANNVYIVAAKTTTSDGRTNSRIIKTDARGQILIDSVITNTSITSIYVRKDGGYVLAADGIEINPLETRITELVNTQAKVLFLDNDLRVTNKITLRQKHYTSTDTLEVDFHGKGIAYADDEQTLILLGSFQEPGDNERSFISAFSHADGTLQWTQRYGLLDMSYINCNSLFIAPGNRLLWASKAFTPIQNLSRSYTNISSVSFNSTFENNSVFGKNDSKNHSVEDLQGAGAGYGVIGTYADTDGSGSNTYFLRVSGNGSIIKGSERYFDGLNLTDDRDVSTAEDHGLAIAGTRDGYVLARRVTTTPTLGNGGADIILTKLDPLGNMLWSRLIGGTGDEEVKAIRETSDGSLLICGTNTINGLSSIMVIRTDSEGYIRD